MIKDINNSSQPIERSNKIIYDYWYKYADSQSPQTVIKEFTNLFLQGRNENIEVSQALEKIIFAPTDKQKFPVFFSNCFYIILDCWSIEPESLSYTSELLNILEHISKASSYDRRRKQLIKLIQSYQKSTAYSQLMAVLAIINPHKIANIVSANRAATDTASNSKSYTNTNINTYLSRYTYLYQYFIPSTLELEQLNGLIESLQSSRKQDFECQLSKHIIYRFRLKEVARMKLLAKGTGKVITKVNNPSILSERAFRVALQQYLGKIENKQTVQQRAQRFVADNKFRNSYRVFKQDLHRFLSKNIKPKNKNYNFKRQLANKLEDIFPQSDNKPLNNTLILQTSRQLFSYLVIDTAAIKPQKFSDLIANLGTAQVMMIIIKITLICPDSKTDLEKKISLIVDRYQMQNIQDVPWLIKTLEHLLIAFEIYFGSIDVSIARSVINK